PVHAPATQAVKAFYGSDTVCQRPEGPYQQAPVPYAMTLSQDSANRILTKAFDSSHRLHNSYDQLGRLTGVCDSSFTGGPCTPTYAFTYDAADNRTDLNMSIGPGNRVSVQNCVSYSYDLNGNLFG